MLEGEEMNLYEIDRAMKALVDPETGELMDYEAFSELQMDRDSKIENMALWIKNLTAEAKAIKEEEVVLKERRQRTEAKAARLKDYLREALCGEKFQTARCSISYRKSTALEVEDTTSLAEWLDSNGHPDMVVYAAPLVDKRAVTDLLKGGVDIPGAVLVERTNMQVR